MNRKLMKRMEMAAGIVEFQRNNPLTDRSQVAIAAQFAKKAEEAESLGRAAHKEMQAARAAGREAKELRRGLEAHLLPSLSSIAAVALRGDVQAAGRFAALPANTSRAVFVSEVASVLDAAREHQEVLARHGFTKGQLSELSARLQQLQRATTAVKTAQQRHREIGAKLSKGLGELNDLLRLLDAFQRVRLERDPELLQVWNSLRTVGTTTAARRARKAAETAANTAATAAPSAGETAAAKPAATPAPTPAASPAGNPTATNQASASPPPAMGAAADLPPAQNPGAAA